MAFFKNFQQNLPSVSSLLDSVSTTVSSAMDDLSSAVSDVTYTVSDQLTEQVNTIICKVQTDEDDKNNEAEISFADDIQKSNLKQKETEAYGLDLGTDVEGRKSRKVKKNSMWSMEVDTEEIMREKERQEEARRADEEEWEWCYAPNKGWYRIRRDPNQPHNSSHSTDNQKGNCDQTSKEEPVTLERCKNEGNIYNENIDWMPPSKHVNLSTSKESVKNEENGEHMEEDSPERPDISIQGTCRMKNESENEDEASCEEGKPPSSSPRNKDNGDSTRGKLKKKGKAYGDEGQEDIQEKISKSNEKNKKDGDPERGFNESEDKTPKNKDSQQQRSGSVIRDSENAEKEDYSSEASPKQGKHFEPESKKELRSNFQIDKTCVVIWQN
ncbi:midasin-like [Triplophysa rosa]|uniref:Synaptotagmin-14-like n=1 Tax=Triplophysa rosa TaxID=992332 RepID=A0A9W7T2H4_TRIRA|nr:midasin-like [Triplophysa rosa]KAI7790018.1 putative synaptotagmin-14-like [Triplophysa rosa]